MTYLVPLIIFAAFVALRIMNVLAMRKREAQLRAAWQREVNDLRAELDATRSELAVARAAAATAAAPTKKALDLPESAPE